MWFFIDVLGSIYVWVVNNYDKTDLGIRIMMFENRCGLIATVCHNFVKRIVIMNLF